MSKVYFLTSIIIVVAITIITIIIVITTIIAKNYFRGTSLSSAVTCRRAAVVCANGNHRRECQVTRSIFNRHFTSHSKVSSDK
jgi:hypothetical protein